MHDLLERLRALLPPPTSASQHRRVASELRAIAEAMRRERQRPPTDRVSPRAVHAGPGVRPSAFVRISRTDRPGRTRLFVGRALWYALGSPTRLDVQRWGAQVVLVPVAETGGYAVNSSAMPSMWCDSADDLLPADGRYEAEVQGGVLVLGAAVRE